MKEKLTINEFLNSTRKIDDRITIIKKRRAICSIQTCKQICKRFNYSHSFHKSAMGMKPATSTKTGSLKNGQIAMTEIPVAFLGVSNKRSVHLHYTYI